ncbi:hypothetical protein DDB_G0281625 [Dictyostelium discoideum AX4]|uniref:NADAR domain-containing protein n=1 Tax=Dictyostelium discoideum TaxID=44689 RepID=Q54TQ0_DICDI|nr:hypothetical protein DDB_G0281625 [Dictyostelium discoideum AX4]EAL66574.1 hypothetical protein DDB_G0281625 [Dictyostelium discoideum AX4]|eukprot:XP_640541.1 hypothetical protein DDB_G0281625 [Dictyostelium discoideum AX4]
MDENNIISFYRSTDAYGCFTNFSWFKVHFKNHTFKTSEHAFQAFKFEHEQKIFFQILNSKTASESKRIAHLNNDKKRKDWETIKDQIMYEICFEKFNQNDHLKLILLDTGNLKIVESSEKDFYWGIGDGSGRNQLGITLMKIREDLRKLENNF